MAKHYEIQGVALETITEQMESTKAGVQFHFSDKEQLMNSVEEASLNMVGKPFLESAPAPCQYSQTMH